MHRRRSAFTVSAAVALLAAVPLLTGCSDDTHPGAAAVVEGKRITMGELQAQVREVREAQQDVPQSEQLISQSGDLTRFTLNGMILDKIVDRIADDKNITVNRREVQQARGDFEKLYRGAERFKAVLLTEHRVAPGELDSWVRMQVKLRKVAEAAGVQLGSPQGNQAVTKILSDFSGDMDIDVNPRYGKWSAEPVELTLAKHPWLNDVSGREAARQQHA